MSTELERRNIEDCYGMTPEERAEFEAEMVIGVRNNPFSRRASDGVYCWGDVHQAALGWAACAKLYRERLKEAAVDIQELEDEVMARSQDDGKLEREIERLRDDVARLEDEIELLRWL